MFTFTLTELEALKKEWLEEMKANMDGNDKELEEMKKTYEEKIKAAHAANQAQKSAIDTLNQEKKTKPHIYNLNFDPQLSGKIVHILQKAETELGNSRGKESDICIIGPGYVRES